MNENEKRFLTDLYVIGKVVATAMQARIENDPETFESYWKLLPAILESVLRRVEKTYGEGWVDIAAENFNKICIEQLDKMIEIARDSLRKDRETGMFN